jgi:hypothetical protein
MEKAGHILVTQGWAGCKPCLVIVNTGAYVTVARSDRTLTVTGKFRPYLAGRSPDTDPEAALNEILVFAADITCDSAVEVGILHIYIYIMRLLT